MFQKRKRLTSTNTTSLSVDTNCEPEGIDITQALSDTKQQASNMATTLVLTHDTKGDMHDSDNHLRKAAD